MILSELITYLDNIATFNPDALDFEVIKSADEGLEFPAIEQIPVLGVFDAENDNFIPFQALENKNEQCNTICL